MEHLVSETKLTVDRYEIGQVTGLDGCPEATTVADPDGTFVYYEDYEKLQKQLEELQTSKVQTTTNQPFTKEIRYLVVKHTDMLNYLTEVEQSTLKYLAAECERRRSTISGRVPREYVVVESDWPEYEPTWQAIKLRSENNNE